MQAGIGKNSSFFSSIMLLVQLFVQLWSPWDSTTYSDNIMVFRANDWFKFVSVSLSLLWIYLLLPVRIEIFNVLLVFQKCNPILPNTRCLYSNFELRSIIVHTSFVISPFFLTFSFTLTFPFMVKDKFFVVHLAHTMFPAWSLWLFT